MELWNFEPLELLDAGGTPQVRDFRLCRVCVVPGSSGAGGFEHSWKCHRASMCSSSSFDVFGLYLSKQNK